MRSYILYDADAIRNSVEKRTDSEWFPVSDVRQGIEECFLQNSDGID